MFRLLCNKTLWCLSLLGLMLLSSCRSTRTFVSPSPGEYRLQSSQTSASGYKNVQRVRQYEFAHRDVPAGFDGCRLAFVSDLHYKSLLKEKGLRDITRLLNHLHVDALLIGGDLQEGCEYVPAVIAALGEVKTPMGTYAVLGNNDYERCYEDIVGEMQRQGIHLLEHKVDTLRRGGDHILIAGVRNPFDFARNGVSPTLELTSTDFVVLLTHTPDYAEDVPVTNADLVLAGHTHGGQVTLFGLYAPIVPSHYGQHFLKGVKTNTQGQPVIITNGIGTSNKNLRLFAPSEVVVITLKRLHHPSLAASSSVSPQLIVPYG